MSPADHCSDWNQQRMTGMEPAFASDFFQDAFPQRSPTYFHQGGAHSDRGSFVGSNNNPRHDSRCDHATDSPYQVCQQFPQALAYLDSLVNSSGGQQQQPARIPQQEHSQQCAYEQSYMQPQHQSHQHQHQLMWNMYNNYGGMGLAGGQYGASGQQQFQSAPPQESKAEKRRRQNRESQQRFRDKRRQEKQEVAAKKSSAVAASISKSGERKGKKSPTNTRKSKCQDS